MRLAELAGLPFQIHPEQSAEQDHREDDSNDAERIGNRVGEGRQFQPGGVLQRQRLEGLLGGTEGRGVGGGAREQSHRRRQIDVHQLREPHGTGGAEEDDRAGHQIERQAFASQRREESGTHLEADGVHEEHQAQVASELEHRALHPHLEVAEQDADEQHPRHPEADAPDAELPEGESKGRNRRQHQQGVGDGLKRVQFPQPAGGCSRGGGDLSKNHRLGLNSDPIGQTANDAVGI